MALGLAWTSVRERDPDVSGRSLRGRLARLLGRVVGRRPLTVHALEQGVSGGGVASRGTDELSTRPLAPSRRPSTPTPLVHDPESDARCAADWRRPGAYWRCRREAGHAGRHVMRRR